jgi:hypothetical protein
MGILTDTLQCELGKAFYVKGNVEKGAIYKFEYEIFIGSSVGETKIGGNFEGKNFDGDGIEVILKNEYAEHASPYGRMCYIKAKGKRKRPLQDEETVEYITYINLFGDLLPEFKLSIEIDNSGTDFDTDRAIKGFSKVTARISEIKAKYGATVAEAEFTGGVFSKKFNVTQGGFDPNADSYEITLNPIENTGEIFVYASVLTSNGYRSSESISFKALDYASPYIEVERAKRYYEEGGEKIYIESSSDGSKDLRYPIELSGEIVPCTMKDENGNQLCKIISIEKRATVTRVNDAKRAEIEIETEGNSFSFSGTPYFGDKDTGTQIFCAYNLEIKCKDSSGREYELIYRINTLGTAFHLRAGGNGAKFGGYATEDDLLESDWKIRGNAGLEIEGETSLKETKMTSFKLGDESAEYTGVGTEENNLAKGNHCHGYIGSDGKLYDAAGIAQKKTVLVTDEDGKIVGIATLPTDFLLMATDDGVMQAVQSVASVGSTEKGLCYADHVHPYSDLWKNDEEFKSLVSDVAELMETADKLKKSWI